VAPRPFLTFRSPSVTLIPTYSFYFSIHWVGTWLPIIVPTIMCGTDRIALGLLHAVRERSFEIPGDLSIIGFDGIPMIRCTDPAIASNRQPLSEMGFTAGRSFSAASKIRMARAGR
jgi:hypothetical protein